MFFYYIRGAQKMIVETRLFWVNIFYTFVRVFLCGIFFYAGILKLNSPQDFAIIISEFGLALESTVMPIAVLLPLVEVFVAVALFFDIRGALGTILLLLLFFMSIVSYALWLGLDIDCGCFGPGDPEFHAYEGLQPTLYRDTIMVAGVIILYWLRRLASVELIVLGKKRNR